MVDIANVMGDAPQERETAGTSGRVRVSGLDFSGLAGAAQAAASLFKKEDTLAADLDRYASLAYDPENAAADQATADIAKRLQLMDEQGNLTKSEVARRKQRLMTEFIKKYPGYGDKLAERFSKFKNVLGDVTEEADAEAQYQRAQEQTRRTERDKALSLYGYNPAEMRESDRDALFEERVRGPVARMEANKRRLEELQTRGGILSETARIESLEIADATLDDSYERVNAEIASTAGMSFEKRREALTKLRYQVDRQVTLFSKGMSSEQREARYGALFRIIDSELKLNENLDPAALADRRAKLSDNELKALENDLGMQKALARQRLYSRVGVVEGEVAREVLGGLSANWTRNDQSLVFNQFFDQLAAFTGVAEGQAAKVDARTGQPTIPSNTLSQGRPMSSDKLRERSLEFNKALGVFLQGSVNEMTAKSYGNTVLGGLNDVAHGTSMVGVDVMLASFAQPKTAELLSASPVADKVAEISNELLTQYINDLSRSFEATAGFQRDSLQMDVDEKGTYTIRPKKKIVNGREVTAMLPRKAKDVERRINLAVKSYAHLNGMTDYAEAAKALFGVEE